MVASPPTKLHFFTIYPIARDIQCFCNAQVHIVECCTVSDDAACFAVFRFAQSCVKIYILYNTQYLWRNCMLFPTSVNISNASRLPTSNRLPLAEYCRFQNAVPAWMRAHVYTHTHSLYCLHWTWFILIRD